MKARRPKVTAFLKHVPYYVISSTQNLVRTNRPCSMWIVGMVCHGLFGIWWEVNNSPQWCLYGYPYKTIKGILHFKKQICTAGRPVKLTRSLPGKSNFLDGSIQCIIWFTLVVLSNKSPLLWAPTYPQPRELSCVSAQNWCTACFCIIEFQVAFVDEAADCDKWQWSSKVLPNPCGYIHHVSLHASHTILLMNVNKVINCRMQKTYILNILIILHWQIFFKLMSHIC